MNSDSRQFWPVTLQARPLYLLSTPAPPAASLPFSLIPRPFCPGHEASGAEVSRPGGDLPPPVRPAPRPCLSDVALAYRAGFRAALGGAACTIEDMIRDRMREDDPERVADWIADVRSRLQAIGRGPLATLDGPMPDPDGLPLAVWPHHRIMPDDVAPQRPLRTQRTTPKIG